MTRFSDSSLTLRWPMATALAILSMLLLPALTYSILNHPPEYDELLHILAARGINDAGVPSIADGLYTRAELYTQLIAWVTGFSDNELLVARLPAVFFGMLATGLLTAWVGVRVGWIAAVVVAGVFVIYPTTIHQSALVRFYTLHTLLMAALLLLWFDASQWQRTARNFVLLFVSSAALIWLGLQIHLLTQISVLSGIGAIVVLLLYDHKDSLFALIRRWRVLFALGFITLIALITFFTMSIDLMGLLRGKVPLWSVNRADNYAFYISSLSNRLPFFFPLFAVMIIGAFYEKPRLAIFCLTSFTISLIVNSIAAQKAPRYFYHAYPMFCVIWAVGFQRVFMYVFNELRVRQRAWAFVIIPVVLSVCLVSTDEVKRGIKLVLDRGQLDGDAIPFSDEPDWSLSLPVIGELAQSVDTLVVTSGVKGQYTFGKYDYEMSATVVKETDTGLEFGNDRRSNRQVISQPESVQRIIDADGQSLFVLENRMINQSYSSPVESVSVLNQECEAIDLSTTGSRLSAWLC